jgi:hypothetical protein
VSSAVKITRLADTIRIKDPAGTDRPVQDRPEKEGFQQYLEDRQKDDSQNDQEKKDPSQQEVEQAIQQFAADRIAREQGLQANLVGQGPGLKVVLKDGTGAVIRQFTGDEFVKMREAVSQSNGPGRGSLLDQKL